MAGVGDAAKLCLQLASLPNFLGIARGYAVEEGNESNPPRPPWDDMSGSAEWTRPR